MNLSNKPTRFDAAWCARLVRKLWADYPEAREALWFLQSRCADGSWDAESYRSDLLYSPQALRFRAFAQQRREWIDQTPKLAQTKVDSRICHVLNMAAAGALTLIVGGRKIGKSTSARTWSRHQGGVARVAEVAAGASRLAFFVSIGRALDGDVILNGNSYQLRNRIEAALLDGGLTLVLDRAERLWTEGGADGAVPFRLSWVLEMASQGVRIALITSQEPWAEFLRGFGGPSWIAHSLTDQLMHCESLPSLDHEGLAVVVASMLPQADKRAQAAVVTLVESNPDGNLADVERVAFHAARLAKEAGRSQMAADDIRAAIRDWVAPSNLASGALLGRVSKRIHGRPAAAPLQPARMALAEPLPDPVCVPASGRRFDPVQAVECQLG